MTRPAKLWTTCTRMSPSSGWPSRRRWSHCNEKFLQKALGYYERFAGQASADAKVRLKMAQASRRIAGNSGEARTSW